MARAIERIEKDIIALKEATRAIAQQLNFAYARYINILGLALQKQLILASYYLCTQGYPDEFLNLSLTQRQKLQQGIRQLGQQATQELISYIQPSEVTETEVVATDQEENQQQPPAFDPSHPIELVEWQQDVEQGIEETLKKVSQRANILIQKTGVLPKKLPEAILAAATAASESSGDMMPSFPNILNLVIEISDQEDAEDAITQIMAIHLRLEEIEFADVTLLTERKGIRNILMQLSKLGREYQKRQKELKISEAEAAWRASWFED
ncbi:MAG: hypothetical protein ACKPCG_08585 [Dolichospermum sp.]